MAKTPSTMLELGTTAPSFSLPDARGATWSLDSFKGAKGYLVMFICNHCPYVKHLARELAQISKEFSKEGVAVIAINSNDFTLYPDDAPSKMLEEAKLHGWEFPYLIDKSQDIAKAYQAACTPDFFLFDSSKTLYYRGQFDSSRPGNGVAVTGEDLKGAVDSLLKAKAAPSKQLPSLGCNIKWTPGNEPKYYPHA